MKKEEFDKLPDTEKQHFNFCAKCSLYFDLRDAAQVQKHVHGITSDSIRDSRVEMANL